MIAILALAIVLPIVVRRWIDASYARKLIERNARTLHRHYERVDDAAQVQKLPPELRTPGVLVRVEFKLSFDGLEAAANAQQAWNAVQQLGLAVRSERTGSTGVMLFGSMNLPGGDVATLTHVHLQLEQIARDHGGIYAGWNAGPVKRAG